MQKRLLAPLLLFAALLLCTACRELPWDGTDEPSARCSLRILDAADGTLLRTLTVASGEAPAPEIPQREGEEFVGFFADAGLREPFDGSRPLTADGTIYAAWRTSLEDTRAWMLAGSLRAYPENNDGRAWPQDAFLLRRTAHNTFEITADLYAGDEFTLAVIEPDEIRSASVGAEALEAADGLLLAGAENRIRVRQSGKYRLTLTTDRKTAALCRIRCLRVGKTELHPSGEAELRLWASFLNWDFCPMRRDGDSLTWYCEVEVPEGGGEYLIKNSADGTVYSDRKAARRLEEGRQLVVLTLVRIEGELYAADISAQPPECYLALAGSENDADAWLRLRRRDDGTYARDVRFTEDDVDGDGSVSFRIFYGTEDFVPQAWRFGGADGRPCTAAPGEYTVVFDPQTGAVRVAPRDEEVW